MPAESVAQRRLFGIVRGLQKGTVKPDSVSGEAKHLAKTVKPESADHFAKTPEKHLPEHKKKASEADIDLIKKARSTVEAYVRSH